MRSYGSYIAGSDVPSENWVYTIRASAFLDDFLPNLKVKRELERGTRTDGDSLPSVAARCALTGEADLQDALVRAKEAAPKWAAFPLETRMRLGARVHEEVLRRKEEFLDVLVAEGHPRRLAEWEIAGILQGTSPETLDLWRRQMREEHQVGPRRLLLVRKPDGVVVLSPPQNAAASNSILGVPALVAGNSLVVKAPRSSPFGVMFAWREIVAPILDELGAPPGTLGLVCGLPNKILAQWLDSPLVDDIFFFGGSERGIQLGQDAVARGKKPVLELAGNDGCVVWKDADLDLAAEALTESFFGSGQICMVPKYAVVHPDVADRLLARLASLAAKIRPGYPEDPEVLLSPVMRTDEYFAHLNQATAAGARVITGGHRVEIDGTVSETGPFLAPTVLRVDGLTGARELSAVREETFFPLLPVVVPTADDGTLLDEVIAFLNGNKYGLRNSLWTSDPDVIDKVAAGVTNGGLLKVNDSHIGFVPLLSTHGGTGLTGGPFGELNYPLLRTSHLQGISIAEGVQPRTAVFESAASASAAEEEAR
ncbi:aldehyde dehydrogenase family protein [Saccharothrix sp. NRRL B-16314]|uniref:aldehyde dehydrogenase family protein n=1 Tax=Saccharothrix sp. NRRL B-16314 TaxID=1463825 RepID=UPI0009DE88E3|nr:aldehyde dehydrogenase [Saccharothrix sp. NRRL B-16314]